MTYGKLATVVCALAVSGAAIMTEAAEAAPLRLPAAAVTAPSNVVRAQVILPPINNNGPVFYRHGPARSYPGAHRYYHRRYRDDASGAIVPFALGAIVGGALMAPPVYAPPPPVYVRPAYPPYAGGSAHVRWCYERYRSYRAWDNSWQPYHGPRRQCYSPYS